MKKQDLFKFSLTAICVAVLSACGSSGGGSLAVENTPTTPSANTNTNTGSNNSAALTAAQQAAQEAAEKQAAAEKEAAAAKAAAEKAAAEKAAAEQAAKQAADKAAADLAAAQAAAQAAQDEAVKKAAEEAAKKALEAKAAADAAAAEAAAAEAAAKKAAEDAEKAKLAEAFKANPFGSKDLLQATPTSTSDNTSFAGLKHVVKTKSNLATNSSTERDSTSDIPTAMKVQNLQRTLDTIVVAEPYQTEAGAPRTYLEDFDTRTTNFTQWQALQAGGATPHAETATNKFMNDKSIGNTALQHIYIDSITTVGGRDSKDSNPVVEAERRSLQEALDQAVKAYDASNSKLTTATRALNDFEGNIGYHSNVDNPTTTGAFPSYNDEVNRLRTIIGNNTKETTVRERAQQELDVLINKHNQLSDAKAQAAPLVENQRIARENAANALNKFNTENPIPTSMASIDTSRLTAAANLVPGVVVNSGTGNGNALYETKTATMGTKNGAIWTFARPDIEGRHQNFTEYSESIKDSPNVVKKGFVLRSERDLNGNLQVNRYEVKPLTSAQAGRIVTNNEPEAPKVGLRTQDNSVAEVYGYRSKAMGSFDSPLDTIDNSLEPNSIVPANNLPLVNDYKGAKLQHVQYGRVTSALSDRASTDAFYKEGLRMNTATKTYVASFGEYGEEGTENHYYFRGVDNVGGTELTKLKEDTKNGVITYEGHAVTYGLNNNYMGNRAIPNALGEGSGFVSGNHAKAQVNLSTNAVTGSIFNKWYDPASPKALRDIDLVQFKGTIADNGNIAGNAVRVDNQTGGLFGATLYGAGSEMGGTVASHDKSVAGQWGGVFGAIRTGVQEAPKVAPQDANAGDQFN